jgi:hypothetical protein
MRNRSDLGKKKDIMRCEKKNHRNKKYGFWKSTVITHRKTCDEKFTYQECEEIVEYGFFLLFLVYCYLPTPIEMVKIIHEYCSSRTPSHCMGRRWLSGLTLIIILNYVYHFRKFFGEKVN